MNAFRHWLLGFFFACMCWGLQVGPGKVTVSAIDEFNKPVEEAIAEVLDNRGALYARKESTKGVVSFSDLPLGKSSIRISSPCASVVLEKVTMPVLGAYRHYWAILRSCEKPTPTPIETPQFCLIEMRVVDDSGSPIEGAEVDGFIGPKPVLPKAMAAVSLPSTNRYGRTWRSVDASVDKQLFHVSYRNIKQEAELSCRSHRENGVIITLR